MIKINKWMWITLFAIFIALGIGISILNDDSSRETIKQMFCIVLGIVAFFFVVSYIRYKIGSE